MIDFGTRDTSYRHAGGYGLSAGLGWVGTAEAAKNSAGVAPGESVTFGQVSQKMTFAANAPELDSDANLTPSERQRHFQSICAKLINIRGTGTGRSVMFDLYAIMALFQEVAQSLRNASRELRKIENQVIFTNIKNQAEIQRRAAVTAAIVGAVMCGVQAAVTVGGLVKQLKGLKAQALAGRLTCSTADAKVANFNKVGNNMAQAGKNLSTMQKKMPGVNPEMTNLNAVKGEPVPASKMQKLEANVKTTQAAYETAQGDLSKLKEAKAPQKEIDAAQAKVEQTKRESVGAKLEYDTAVSKNTEFNNAALKDVDKYRNEALSAGERYSDALEGYKDGKISKKELKQAKADFDKAEKNYVMAGAKQADLSARLQLPADTYKGMGQSFDMQAGKSRKMISNHPVCKNAEISGLSGQIMNQLGMQIGQYLQQLVQSIKEIMSSKATELQAQQKVTEEQFDQIRDLFTQFQSVVQKVIDLFSAVTQKESQTIEDIMNNFKA